MSLLQRLKDWYIIEVKDNTAVFISEYFHIKVSRNIIEVMAAGRRQRMRKEDIARKEYYQECRRKTMKYKPLNNSTRSIRELI